MVRVSNSKEVFHFLYSYLFYRIFIKNLQLGDEDYIHIQKKKNIRIYRNSLFPIDAGDGDIVIDTKLFSFDVIAFKVQRKNPWKMFGTNTRPLEFTSWCATLVYRGDERSVNIDFSNPALQRTSNCSDNKEPEFELQDTHLIKPSHQHTPRLTKWSHTHRKKCRNG